MTFVETAARGAAANRRTAQANPMSLLRKLRENDKTGSMAVVLKKWKQQIIDDTEMLDAALVYAGTNYWHSLEQDEKKQIPLKTRQAQAQQAEALAQEVRQIVLMDLLLPNGKQLRNATFADCQKAGGWFLRIAKKGRPHQVVGNVLTEEQLRKI
jgi:hypothetical protein